MSAYEDETVCKDEKACDGRTDGREREIARRMLELTKNYGGIGKPTICEGRVAEYLTHAHELARLIAGAGK